MKLVPSISSLALAMSLTACGKPEPLAFQISFHTQGKIGEIVVPTEGKLFCEKGLKNITQDTEIEQSSEEKLVQMKNIQSATFWYRTPDGRYTVGKDEQGNIVFRLINIDGNGTTALINQDDIKGAQLESCSE